MLYNNKRMAGIEDTLIETEHSYVQVGDKIRIIPNIVSTVHDSIKRKKPNKHRGMPA
jgi:hypothetical protein